MRATVGAAGNRAESVAVGGGAGYVGAGGGDQNCDGGEQGEQLLAGHGVSPGSVVGREAGHRLASR